ncbi:AlbA family DNA-binding domain-containing protein [Actinacidiphila sp. ITFR-21]|uniref:AlbA family DNA-binding domain-containing protein n=1 Tax=Actinacidiphila sp. ITFR-21 TaxID=3075199 RepID=UPI00288A2582|nr:ATP-binding protein [Streptomyces sp. ITFR-21]WNI20264.1 ATP-binding protein [Streptomyces sp. ITFR-21]
MNIEDVRAALSAGDFAALIGIEECGWMDVKSAPYMVDEGPRPKEELVKDVAGFANTATGGLLIIGFKAIKANGVETVSEVNAVPRTLVDTETYRKLIDERVYPHIEGLELKWVECGNGKGVLSIDIPAQPASARPFVIPPPTRKDSPSVAGLAVPVRRGDQTVFWSRQETHRQLSAGWMAIGAPATDDSGVRRAAEGSVALHGNTADRSKAQRILAAMPFDAPWLRMLQGRPTMRRVRADVTRAIDTAWDSLIADNDIKFLDPELVDAHATFMDSLRRVIDELDGMFDPDDGSSPPAYVEVPPEWKRSDPERYQQMLADLSEARDAFLEARIELMNSLNRRGLLS